MTDKKTSAKDAKSATSSHKPTAKDLKEEDVEFEIDEYEFDKPHASQGCGCGCGSKNLHY